MKSFSFKLRAFMLKQNATVLHITTLSLSYSRDLQVFETPPQEILSTDRYDDDDNDDDDDDDNDPLHGQRDPHCGRRHLVPGV